MGIDPEDRETVFNEFKQLDSSRARQYEGTGLGLALTRRLVELHGGTIWLESEGLGMGSKFSFALPVKMPDMDEHKASPEEFRQRVSERLPSAVRTPGWKDHSGGRR